MEWHGNENETDMSDGTKLNVSSGQYFEPEPGHFALACTEVRPSGVTLTGAGEGSAKDVDRGQGVIPSQPSGHKYTFHHFSAILAFKCVFWCLPYG